MYHEIEAQDRQTAERARPARMAAVEAVLILASFLFLGYLLYIAQFSGAVRWFLGFLLVGAAGLYAWHQVHRRTAEAPPLHVPAPSLPGRTGELTSFTLVVRRAESGLAYSQALASSRARDAFAEHARLSLGLTPDAMRRLASDLEGLRRTFHDPVLADFLYAPTPDPEGASHWLKTLHGKVGFEPSLRDVLDRMEAWR